jgi:uncharacterized RDD family membrane protein YckC
VTDLVSGRVHPTDLATPQPTKWARGSVGDVNPEAWRRIVAWLVDWLCFLVWLALVAAIGVPLYLAGVTGQWSPVTTNVVSALVTAVPLTVFLAVLESGTRQASVGKCVLGLKVVALRDGGRLSFASALLRNVLKVAVPWTIGHAAAIALVGSTTMSTGLAALTAAAYVLPLVYAVTLFAGKGRTPYDRAAGAGVVRA